jgi:beta-galactosidase
MDNIGDPDYVREVGIFADALTKRYAHHPAVIAVGYNNEIGNGFMSYSEADRQRFIAWLKRSTEPSRNSTRPGRRSDGHAG